MAAGDSKRNRAFGFLAFLLALACICAAAPGIARAETFDQVYDFEALPAGPFPEQAGWYHLTNVSVTDETAKNGTKSMLIDDDDSARAFGPFVNFPAMSKGKVEWWAKAESQVRLIAQLQSYSSQGTLTAEWMGFNTTGKFVYYDGMQRVDTPVSYELDHWYRFTLLFDAESQTKTLLISDDSGVIFAKTGIAFRDAGISSLNRFRFSTISTDVGKFYLDDFRVTDRLEDSAEEIIDLSFLQSNFVLNVGETAQLETIAKYANGGIQFVTEGIWYDTDSPEVAVVDDHGLITATGYGEAVITVTNGVYGAEANVNVYAPGEAPPYKPIEPRHLERETDLREFTIWTPEAEEWAAAGQRIAGLLKEKWNIDAAVAVSKMEDVGDGWSGNHLVLGNLGNHPHIARLYGLYLSYTDAVHPGAGGYQLQTLVDPFGRGGNTILLGASDVSGLTAGVERLAAVLEGLSDPVLPWLSESKLSREAASYLPFGEHPTEEDVAAIKADADARFAKLNPHSTAELDADVLLALFSKVMYHGKLFQLTNNDRYGEMYRYYLNGYADFLNRYPQTAQAQLLSSRNMWTSGYAAIGAYAVMEASPIFSEEDRKKFVSAWYLTYEANSHDGYITKAPPTGARYNHDVFPALSIIFGASYFQKYHQLPEAQAWHQLGERIFTGNTSNINYDEGSDYLMHVPAVTLEYAMATGDRRFLAKGLRPSADLNAMMIDNLGTMSGGGDVYPFGRSSAYSWNHSQVMHAATWFFGDPIYQFLLERTRTGPFDGQGMSDLEFPFHRYMTDAANVTEVPEPYPLVLSYPVEQGVYDEVLKDVGGALDVEIEDTFHKLAFRQGLEINDSYLMLDGFSAGRHGHMDGNTIIKYSANGRIFIDDRDYIEKAPKHHTGLVVVKDGVQEAKPPLARLEWAADADGIGISRSEMPNYNGTDWTRTIVTPGGRFYLIYDDAAFREDGHYILENTWQTLGNMTIHGNVAEVEQQGVTMRLISLDGSDLREYERYGHFIKYWKLVYPYPYADEEHVLRQVKEEAFYQAGDVSRFMNVLSSHAGEGRPVTAQRLSDAVVRVDEGNGNTWYAVWGEIETEGLASDGKFLLLGPEKLFIAEATFVQVGNRELRFEEPVMFTLNAGTGEWKAYRLTAALTRYDDEGQPIRDEMVDQGTWKDERRLLQTVWNGLSDSRRSMSGEPPRPANHPAERDWRKMYDFGQEITHSSAGDVDGDGIDELLLGGKDGKIEILKADGRVLWSFQSKGRVNEVTVQSVSGVPLVFVATENWYIHVLDAEGNERWHKEIPNDSARREQKGNLLGVTNIRMAHVNGQNEDPWIMVGTQFRYLYGFDLQGNLQYEDIAYFYGIEDMEFVDLDGDGKDEGVLGLEYYYYSIWNEEVLTRYGGTKDPGPGFKVVEAIPEWSGSDLPAAVYGTKQNRVHLIQYNGSSPREIWRVNVGGEVNDIQVGDFDGDGKTEFAAVSDGFQVYLIEADGSVRWRTTMKDRALKLSVQQTSEGVQYLVMLDNGGLVTLNAQGEIVSQANFRQRLQSVYGSAPKAWAVTEAGEIYRMK